MEITIMSGRGGLCNPPLLKAIGWIFYNPLFQRADSVPLRLSPGWLPERYCDVANTHQCRNIRFSGCANNGSQNITASSFSATSAPTCWSPPIGPLCKRVTGIPLFSMIFCPVVLVATRLSCDNFSLYLFTSSAMTSFLASWATIAIVYFFISHL